MRPLPRGFPRALALLLTAAAVIVRFPARDAAAQQPASVDSSELLVFEHDMPVAHERSQFQNMGDSLVVLAETQRNFVDENGKRHPFKKNMVLVVDSRDLGLIRYVSNQSFNDHEIVRGLLPGDTSMTYYIEMDGGGDADRVVQPPGRLYVMDSQMFSLFDVLARSLSKKTFTTRRVQLLALTTDSLAAPLATITALGSDTLAIGQRKQPVKHYAFEDASARFELWTDPAGRLVRLTHAESGLRVERAPAQAPRAPKPAAKPGAKPKPPGPPKPASGSSSSG